MIQSWYNTGVANQKSDRSGAGNTLRSDTGKGLPVCIDHTTNTPSLVKTCTKCGQTKPATTEYFSRDRQKKDGLSSDCKKCRSVRARAHYESHKDRELERARAYRESHKEQRRAYRKANLERAAAWMRSYREARKEHVAEQRRVYREANRGYLAEQRRAHYEANKERVKAQNRTWYRANRERDLEKGRAYREANPEREAKRHHSYYEANRERIAEYGRVWRDANRERIAERVKVWRKANPRRARASVNNYRARKRNAEGSHTAKDVQRQYKAQKGRCYYCNVKVGKDYDVDHVVPLSRGGSNDPSNLVIACSTCNRSKGDKLPHEWVHGGKLL